MLIAADVNKMKAKVVQEEISIKFNSLNDDYQTLIEKVEEFDED